jgi:methylmalonyl-CoA mutase cobalamin-binding subunit
MDHRTRFTATLREALRGFVGSDQYRSHFPAQKIYPTFDPGMVEEMALLSFELDSTRFLRHTEDMLRSCIDAEQFMVEAITGAAVVLGDWWASDRLNYRAVELGSERLQDLVYDIADQRLLLGHGPSNPHKIFLTMPSNSRHTLGLAVMGEIFHWHGWNVVAGPTLDHNTLPERLNEEWVDVLGISVADDRDMDLTRDMIQACRSHSRNQQIWIMVGGPQAFLRPDLAAEVGADAACSHAGQAQAMALARVRQVMAQLSRATENRG